MKLSKYFRIIFAAMMITGVGFSAAHGEMMDKMDKMMDGMMKGMLAGAGDHHAAGTVMVDKNKITITDLKVDKVPDGRVYLAKDGDYTKGVEVGKLKQFSGTVEYMIPSTVNTHDYNSVVIWCQKFSVEIGHAFFEKEKMKMDDSMMDQKMDMKK